MAQESQKRDYMDPEEIKLGMKEWISQNGGKKAFSKGKHPIIKTQDDLRKEIISKIKFNRLLEEESKADEVTLEDARNYYDARPDLFESETLITASHILKKQNLEMKWFKLSKNYRNQKITG